MKEQSSMVNLNLVSSAKWEGAAYSGHCLVLLVAAGFSLGEKSITSKQFTCTGSSLQFSALLINSR